METSTGDDVMSDQDQSASQLKQQQRIDWDAAAAGWKQWWSTFERAAQHVSDRLVELAAVRPGLRLVDLATGIGEPALTAARRVGTAGRVVAIDQSPGMLAVARERAAALGLGNLEFRVGDIESLEADEHSFDAAICRWGLMFVPDLDSAARGIRRALTPGARFATAVWSAPDKVPMISLGGEAMRSLAGLPPRQPGALDPFRLADVSILTRALEGAGFTEVRSEPLEVIFEFASADEFTRFRAGVSAPLRAVLERCTLEVREQIMRATVEAAAPYRRADGSLRLPNVTICVAARA
jgi:SAM-dependent methyltransferase